MFKLGVLSILNTAGQNRAWGFKKFIEVLLLLQSAVKFACLPCTDTEVQNFQFGHFRVSSIVAVNIMVYFGCMCCISAINIQSLQL